MKHFVIIPAAGTGTRMNTDIPKQYLKIHNETILQRVVNVFSSIKQIEKVIIALHADDHWWPTLQLSHPEKVLTVIGGKERVHSVFLGLEFLKNHADTDDFVLVHDAARPGISTKNIIALLAEIKDHPAGGLLGLPVVDTLKKVNQEDEVIETLSREQLWHAQTPQCFRYGLLKPAIERSLQENKIITDEASAMEQNGHHPKMVLGDVRNFKITFPEDLVLAELLLTDRRF
ncbi:MAG: 2-C-methyl-D-erythritol 4-phosphate cytidylyltransferase [Coxiellaceae bacterium]|nr:2-C-methyl-D-erythritol 4-phosphate cytidylyltransferase [Coxiellaceae bacterium]